MLFKKLTALREERSEDGFTLIEVMFVVVIIGILAAVVIPIFANQQKATKDAALKTDLQNMGLAVQTYFSQDASRTYLSVYGSTGPEVLGGWAVVKFGSPDARFRGTSGPTGATATATQEVFPAGMQQVHVSNGVGIGVVSQSGSYNRTFCVAGNAIGSSWDVYTTNGNPLYYDSMYGLTTQENIKADGACKIYKTKVWGQVTKP